ncbi:MAG: hypothetical protein WC749_08700 [Dehalococcoidia bacterium]
MSKLGVLVAMLAVLALLVIPTVVLAQPQVCGFYGSSVTLDGASVSGGTVVTAWIDGAQVKSVTTTGSSYSMNVAGNYSGKTVSFKVGTSQVAATQTALWEAGANKALNLTAVTAPAEPTGITIDPTQGTVTTVSGKGYTPGSAITFTWAGAAVATVPVAVTAGTDGRFSAVIVAPTSTAGNYTIRAVDASAKSAQATFTIVASAPAQPPAVTLSSAQGVMTIIAGSGMTPNSAITFTWAGDPLITYPGTVTADANGKFSAIVTAPTATAGDYVIKAADSASRSAQSTFKVISPAKGDNGAPGTVGKDGASGKDGAPGKDGTPGKDGAAGKNGDDGSSTLGLIAIIIAAVALVLTVIAIVKEIFPGKSRI